MNTSLSATMIFRRRREDQRDASKTKTLLINCLALSCEAPTNDDDIAHPNALLTVQTQTEWSLYSGRWAGISYSAKTLYPNMGTFSTRTSLMVILYICSAPKPAYLGRVHSLFCHGRQPQRSRRKIIAALPELI